MIKGASLMQPSLNNTPWSYVGRGRFNRVIFFTEADSTNSRAMEMARTGEGEGVVVIADTQTAGRGRLGRSWASPAGLNLYMSVVVERGSEAGPYAVLPFIGALAVARAVRDATGLEVVIKWPNDVLLSGRKVAGVLAEGFPGSLGRQGAVLGMVVNVNSRREDWPAEFKDRATSLLEESGRPWDRPALAAGVLESLDRVYDLFLKSGPGTIIELLKQHCATLGRQVRLESAGRIITGLAEDVAVDGRLILRDEDGRTHMISAGDLYHS